MYAAGLLVALYPGGQEIQRSNLHAHYNSHSRKDMSRNAVPPPVAGPVRKAVCIPGLGQVVLGGLVAE